MCAIDRMLGAGKYDDDSEGVPYRVVCEFVQRSHRRELSPLSNRAAGEVRAGAGVVR